MDVESQVYRKLKQALWLVYQRPETPKTWVTGGNLPWNDPAFSTRMLQEHLDESHGAASRITAERHLQITWLWQKLALLDGAKLLDVTCGPGLYTVEFAKRGCLVTGVDFGPAAIQYARQLAEQERVNGRSTFIEQDVRQMRFAGAGFDAAIFLYGQLAVFPKTEAFQLLQQMAQSLKPGGQLCVELLNQEKVDKTNSNWWFTDQTGLWGDSPFLHLGERFWVEEEATSVERYHILHLETGEMDEIQLCDQTYSVEEMVETIKRAGFSAVSVYPAWDGLDLYDANEWVIYVAEK
jgi:ubiquinone/menaquinone biosynthesis C-methylase UbiE